MFSRISWLSPLVSSCTAAGQEIAPFPLSLSIAISQSSYDVQTEHLGTYPVAILNKLLKQYSTQETVQNADLSSVFGARWKYILTKHANKMLKVFIRD